MVDLLVLINPCATTFIVVVLLVLASAASLQPSVLFIVRVILPLLLWCPLLLLTLVVNSLSIYRLALL
jgi:hypothetical protein